MNPNPVDTIKFLAAGIFEIGKKETIELTLTQKNLYRAILEIYDSIGHKLCDEYPKKLTAGILMRSLIEYCFWLRFILADKNNEQYFNSKSKEQFSKWLRESNFKSQIIEGKLASLDITEDNYPSIETIAQKLDEQSFYDSVYRAYCQYTHPTIMAKVVWDDKLSDSDLKSLYWLATSSVVEIQELVCKKGEAESQIVLIKQSLIALQQDKA